MVFLPQINNPRSNHEKKKYHLIIPIEGHLIKHLYTKSYKNNICLRNCYIQEDPKETWQVNVMWYPEWDSGIEIDIM